MTVERILTEGRNLRGLPYSFILSERPSYAEDGEVTDEDAELLWGIAGTPYEKFYEVDLSIGTVTVCIEEFDGDTKERTIKMPPALHTYYLLKYT